MTQNNAIFFEKRDKAYHTLATWPEKRRASKIKNICDPHVGLRKTYRSIITFWSATVSPTFALGGHTPLSSFRKAWF